MSKTIQDKVIDLIDRNKINDKQISITFKLDSKYLKEIVKAQQKKGIEKYGHSIDECPCNKFDWIRMMYEEIADFLVYIEKNKQCKKQKFNK